MEPIVVVGAGVAGLACARTLADAGRDVVVLDRGRRPGGRLGSRRLDDRPVDIGPPGFEVTDPAFRAVAEGWRARGLARPWVEHEQWLTADGPDIGNEHPRWVADARALVAHLTEGLDVRSETTVERVGPGPTVDGRHAAAVVLAMPGPQAARLRADADAGATAETGWAPTIVVVAAFAERTWSPFGVARADGPDVALVVDDGRRRGDGAAVLVLHATPERSARHLDDPDGAVAPLLAAVAGPLQLDAPVHTHAHRWTFARPDGPSAAPFHLGTDGIALCGDGWHAPQAGVEAAWLSGVRLARALID